MPSLGRLPIYGQQATTSPIDKPRWRTLAEAAGAAPASDAEFPEGATDPPTGMTRRGFVQVLGASIALAGAAACKPPRQRMVSYVRRPPEVTPSVAAYYATAMAVGGYAVGVVVRSNEGRPTKVEGNRDHPASRGAAGPFQQCYLLDLYDPHRLDGFQRQGQALGWNPLLQELSILADQHRRDGGARLRFLSDPTTSPLVADLRGRVLQRFPRARFDTWSPVGAAEAFAGTRIAFGQPLEVVPHLAEADVILSLDSDFLGLECDALRLGGEFAGRREPQRMNRLYVAEAGYSITGGMADHRLRMRSAEVLGFGRAVAAALAEAGLAELAPLGVPPPAPVVKAARAIAADLARARGRAVVLAGVRQPAAVHALAAAMNEALGASGTLVTYSPSPLLDPEAGPHALDPLVKELQAGQVDTVVVTAWNPAYTAPAGVDLAGLLKKTPNSMYLGLRDDETARACAWVLAAAHPLEAWGDLRARNGLASIVQPLVSPLHLSAAEPELLAAFLDEGNRGAHELLRASWRARAGATDFDRRWDSWLAAGLVEGSEARPVAVRADLARVADAVRAAPVSRAGIEVNFVPDYKLHDGRYLENGWLQELPHPITKLTWENAVHLSPATAARLGVESDDVVELALAGRTVTGSAFVQPGHADEAVTIALGYGQGVAGPVGRGAGFDAYALRRAEAAWFDTGLQVRRTGGRHELAITQGHFSTEGRPIALDFTLAQLRTHGEELSRHRGPLDTIQAPVDYSTVEYRWGMSIDLSRCIGCGACTVACQAENNIPVVGRPQVLLSREMHWIRVDRYFSGTAGEPESISQPMLCQHCEAAPCEYVCPVNATVHSDEGLNEMVYNRCVGTRYCSNNCPYKVRRFNYLDWHGTLPPTGKMVMNPDVTVRARGVMEKCTYCVQRIEHARIDARSQGKKIGGDAVVPACAQTCPTEAIVFGNLNDPGSRVARRARDERRFDVLHELGTRPRTSYLVRVRNPNPDLA
jgi:molybdopterin-containing oxidoreductase family iron-sulfur binding subunit